MVFVVVEKKKLTSELEMVHGKHHKWGEMK